MEIFPSFLEKVNDLRGESFFGRLEALKKAQ